MTEPHVIAEIEPHHLRELADLLLEFHKENGLYPFNAEKTYSCVAPMVSDHMVFGAWVKGRLVGALGIVENDWWYADASFLRNEFYFVLPEFRGAALIGYDLMAAGASLAERRGLVLFISMLNPELGKKRGRMGPIAGYLPVGYAIRV